MQKKGDKGVNFANLMQTSFMDKPLWRKTNKLAPAVEK